MVAKAKTKPKQRVTVIQMPTPRKKAESVIVTLEFDETTRLSHRLAISRATRRASAIGPSGCAPAGAGRHHASPGGRRSRDRQASPSPRSLVRLKLGPHVRSA